jgi:hypothetical protein
LLSVSLYVSTDLGSTWSELPVPSGFAPTSTIACSQAEVCSAGGPTTVDRSSVDR